MRVLNQNNLVDHLDVYSRNYAFQEILHSWSSNNPIQIFPPFIRFLVSPHGKTNKQKEKSICWANQPWKRKTAKKDHSSLSARQASLIKRNSIPLLSFFSHIPNHDAVETNQIQHREMWTWSALLQPSICIDNSSSPTKKKTHYKTHSKEFKLTSASSTVMSKKPEAP